MNQLRKPFNISYQRTFLIIGTGILLVLLLIYFTLPKQEPPIYRPGTSPLPISGKNQNSGAVEASPTATLGFQATAQVLAVQSKNCVYTEEYWGTHPQAWLTDNIIIGKFSFSRQAGLAVINTVTEDLSTLLQKQFLAAALNILSGADQTPIEATLIGASQWISAHPPGVEMPIVERNLGMLLTQRLTDYNQGLSGPVLCLDQPPTATITATSTPTATPTRTVNISSSLPITGATPTPGRDKQGAPSSGTPHRDVPTETTAASAPAVPAEPTSTSQPPANGSGEPTTPPLPAPPSPQPTDLPPEPTQPAEPTSAPPPPEEPTTAPPGDSGATQPPNIGDVLPTLGVPLP